MATVLLLPFSLAFAASARRVIGFLDMDDVELMAWHGRG